jgi:hypothetical protein
MDQQERAELINRSNYWGIISPKDALKVLSTAVYWKGAPNAGWFLWECTSRTSFASPTRASLVEDSYVLVVTQLYSVRENEFYVRKRTSHFGMNTAIGVYERFKFDVDAFSVYIVKSSRDGRYYEFSDKKVMNHLSETGIPNDEEYQQLFSSSTLSEAIEHARMRLPSFARMLVHQCPPFAASICPAIPRFLSYRYVKESYYRSSTHCVNRVWSLQNLCLFFLKNYLKIYRSQYRGPHLPKKLETLIIQMRAVIGSCEE